ncbi:LpqB family beta-propeller domain-containing protein [Streptomyces sp. NPDC017979]|uniref:LpqB family beta-propeller domain-containing protein n=1 Tax=Streptomyces sp. NPDC017979 TaxID=3365024 RepID=UPI0037A9A271
MGAESRGGRRLRLRLGAALGGSGVLLAGCASMPDSGDIHAVKASPRADAQVRVYPVPPRNGAEPREIISGFLEAMTSDDADFGTARTYLSRKIASKWQPEAQTTVLTAAPTTRDAPRRDSQESQGYTFPLVGTRIATVNSQLEYEAETPAEHSWNIHVSKNGEGEWRIDSLPDGLVLGLSDFQRNYRSVNKYYFASDRAKVVADPVFIRQRVDPVTGMDPVTQAVKALLDGPTNWLKPVVESPFPSGTALKEGVTSLTIDDRDVLKIPLNEKAANTGRAQCNKMAVQIMFTLKDLSSANVDQVELQRADGSQLCVFFNGREKQYAPDSGAAGSEVRQYFVNDKRQLAVLNGSGSDGSVPEPVQGPFGEGHVPVGVAAVSRENERTAAVVSPDRSKLHVAPITAPSPPKPPVVTSSGKTENDRLTAPSWDGLGDLWVADRNPGGAKLLRLPSGGGVPQEVPIVPGLDGARISSLKVSADGARIALLLEKDGKTTLQIGRVERSGTGDGAAVSVAHLRAAAPQMETVTAVSWAGASRLVLVGREAGGVPQVRYIQTDGSTPAGSVLPGLNSVKSVTASDIEGRPLVAYSQDDGIVRLPPGGNWQTVDTTGSFPIYPG